MPRFRMTIRRWMLTVAGLAVLCVGWPLFLDIGDAKARALCTNNLKNVALCLQQYHTAYGIFPAGTVVNRKLPPSRRLSWMIFIL